MDNILQISPKMLHWAATQAGYSFDALVDDVIPASKRDLAMAGKLTVSQIEKLAKKVHIPFGYFFLDTPPQAARASIPDLRQTPNPQPLSADFFETLEDVLRKQQWYLDYLKNQSAEPLEFVGKFKFDLTTPAKTVATDISQTLKLTTEERKKCAQVEDFFNLLTTKTEAAGILVIRNGVVKNSNKRALSVREFRGFAIADKYAPIIFINGKDSDAAWIFTFAHELAHIWLGESGVSDLLTLQERSNKNIEYYCNAIAAEFLTPQAEFLHEWERQPEPKIEALSRFFKVSQWVIARRAYDLNKIDWNDYQKIAEASKKNKSTSTSGGDPYRTYPIRNSKRLTRVIVSTAMSGNMMLREAASLLNVNPDTVVELSKRLAI